MSLKTNLKEKEIAYKTSNTYATLNTLTKKTKTIWLVFHGMGYLSQYFLKYFKALPAEDNYIIAPQAPNKFYIQPKMHVGANWLTRVNTETDMENLTRYIDAVLYNECLPKDKNLIVFGYSQGVSIATRYIAKRKIKCSQLVLHSGGIPKELTNEDFNYLNLDCEVKLIYGTEDEYLNSDRIYEETRRAKDIFNTSLQLLPFKGKHVVNIDYINNLI